MFVTFQPFLTIYRKYSNLNLEPGVLIFKFSDQEVSANSNYLGGGGGGFYLKGALISFFKFQPQYDIAFISSEHIL